VDLPTDVLIAALTSTLCIAIKTVLLADFTGNPEAMSQSFCNVAIRVNSRLPMRTFGKPVLASVDPSHRVNNA
jgi:hypothetical protein